MIEGVERQDGGREPAPVRRLGLLHLHHDLPLGAVEGEVLRQPVGEEREPALPLVVESDGAGGPVVPAELTALAVVVIAVGDAEPAEAVGALGPQVRARLGSPPLPRRLTRTGEAQSTLPQSCAEPPAPTSRKSVVPTRGQPLAVRSGAGLPPSPSAPRLDPSPTTSPIAISIAAGRTSQSTRRPLGIGTLLLIGPRWSGVYTPRPCTRTRPVAWTFRRPTTGAGAASRPARA